MVQGGLSFKYNVQVHVSNRITMSMVAQFSKIIAKKCTDAFLSLSLN